MKELSEDNSTKQDEKIKTEGNEDDEEYHREEPRVDEPESLNLRVPQPSAVSTLRCHRESSRYRDTTQSKAHGGYQSLFTRNEAQARCLEVAV